MNSNSIFSVNVASHHFEIDLKNSDHCVVDHYFQVIEKIDAWCRQNCTGLWRNKAIAATWQFANERDATLFKLFWS